MAKLIFGCGYLGGRVARLWRDQGDEVFVVTRSSERAARFTAEGLWPIVADVLDPTSLRNLPAAETVLFAVGYDRTTGAPIHDVFVNGWQATLDSLNEANLRRIIYISSTGVYGQTSGDVVDENSPTVPDREGGKACLAAERLLAAHRLGSKGIVLRMAGLYGPGRIPNVADIRRGEPLSVVEQGFLNLIHIDDAARIVLAAEASEIAPRTYVVSDGEPVERRAYYEELARLLAAPTPRFVTPDVNAPRSARGNSSKRINNARLRAELSVGLRYRSYREGLAAIVASESERPE